MTTSARGPDPYVEQLAVEQLIDVGEMLIRAKIITRKEVQRQGVRFAVRDALEPLPPPQRAARR